MRYPKGHVSTFDAVKYRKERRQIRAYLGLCTRCDSPAVKGFTDCQRCMDEGEKYGKELRAKCLKLGICINCGEVSREGILRCESCTSRLNKNNRDRHRRIKTEVLTHYGRDRLQCCWDGCEVTDLDMLTLDHIENDGAKHRREYTRSGRGGGAALYDKLIREKFPEGFQTLCANHNLKKHIMRLK